MVPEQSRERQVMPLTFQNYTVRMTLIDGVPWFIAKDVCDVLDIKQPTRAIEVFPENEKGVRTIHTLGGKQEMLIVNEPGLYRLIFQSRKPEAERFKTWVFSTVLPQIRQTGCFFPASPAPDLSRITLALANYFTPKNKRKEMLEAGKCLLLLKRSMHHGEFLPCLDNMRIPRRTAEGYMRLFRESLEQIAVNAAMDCYFPRLDNRQLSLFSFHTELPLSAC